MRCTQARRGFTLIELLVAVFCFAAGCVFAAIIGRRCFAGVQSHLLQLLLLLGLIAVGYALAALLLYLSIGSFCWFFRRRRESSSSHHDNTTST
jgi:prepilin-type N-terminal cleavage/methylation domain-containing protein